MDELALFAGAGGGLLGSRLLGWRTVCAVEFDPYRQATLLARQAEGHLDPFPIWDDVRTFDGRPWRGIVDVVTAGFPCQPFSVAGKRRGSDDERNGWPDTIRILREVRPRFALLENVPGLLAHPYFGAVLGDLAEAGFDAEWCVLGAADVGAPHLRRRLWILAYAETLHESKQVDGRREQFAACGESTGHVADAASDGVQGLRPGRIEVGSAPRWAWLLGCDGAGGRVVWWDADPAESPAAESRVGRVANGVADRVDRLAALGDGQVPAVVRAAWHLLYGRIHRPRQRAGR